MVPGGGLEPPRPCGLRILSPLRLPISPSGPVSHFTDNWQGIIWRWRDLSYDGRAVRK